jgi:hypothetical protein
VWVHYLDMGHRPELVCILVLSNFDAAYNSPRRSSLTSATDTAFALQMDQKAGSRPRMCIANSLGLSLSHPRLRTFML